MAHFLRREAGVGSWASMQIGASAIGFRIRVGCGGPERQAGSMTMEAIRKVWIGLLAQLAGKSILRVAIVGLFTSGVACTATQAQQTPGKDNAVLLNQGWSKE